MRAIRSPEDVDSEPARLPAAAGHPSAAARVYDGLDVVIDGSTRVTRGPTGQALFEAFETVTGNGSKATTVTTTRDVLTDVLGSTVTIATGADQRRPRPVRGLR